MDEKTINNNEIEIDLQRLFGALLNRAWFLGLVAVVCAIVTFVSTFFFVAPKYQSSALFYVNNNSVSLGEASMSITASDISASKSLVASYIVILNTRETLNDVIDYAGVNRSYGEVKGMISASAVEETEIFKVVVTSEDPEEAEEIADAIAYILPKRITSIIEGTSTKVADAAVFPTAPSSPSYTKNAVMGFLIGLVLAAALIVIRELLSIAIRTEEDIAQSCKYPVLAAVPDLEAQTKSGSYYRSAGGKKKSYANVQGGKGKHGLVGSDISFAAAESYKLLRTKLLFSFADEQSCRIVGVSSPLTGEGKSLTAVNLAYTTAQLGKRVLLIDCDMRRPSISEKLPVSATPGLSDFLTGQATEKDLIQACGIKGEEKAFNVIAPGRTPPNPMELLSSAKMEKMLTVLREKYDYIILDLPPVGEVSDALVAAKLTDGMLLVVRQNYCDRVVLNTAIRQFEFVDAKILGVIFNCTADEKGPYGNKYYRRYYKKYYGKYNGRAYEKRAVEGETTSEKNEI